ncbi:MAG: DUF3179 domain-containing protein [Anaerolineales bacterium]|nr:DUF3179 domain-containing protein [Anaerolineales bacterium]
MLNQYRNWATLFLVSGLILAACSSASSETTPGISDPRQGLLEPSPSARVLETPTFLPDEPPPSGVEREFLTDFSQHSVPYDEILSGGPPKDGIPAIDDPQFVSVVDAEEWLQENEPVVLIVVGNDARAYPIQILMWHEIVNDTVDGKPLVVSFCPLCNTAIAFERTVNGQVFNFGTTGRLRFSNLIMYDRQTETWWQQATGEAIAGELTGIQLSYYPATIISWEDFKNENPQGSVLSRETGFSRAYGNNPYAGYDDINQSPFLYQGNPTPGTLPPMARVLTVERNGDAVAYSYDVLRTEMVINDIVAGEAVVVFWAAGTASALDTSSIAQGRDVGTAAVYSAELDGVVYGFSYDGHVIRDQQTGSIWNMFGEAIEGDLKGKQLKPLVSINHFWFSWAAFRPETRIYQP